MTEPKPKQPAPPLRRTLGRLRRVVAKACDGPQWLPLQIITDGKAGTDTEHYSVQLSELPQADGAKVLAKTSARIWSHDLPQLRPKLDALGSLGFWHGIRGEFLIEWTVTDRYGLQAVIRDVRSC